MRSPGVVQSRKVKSGSSNEVKYVQDEVRVQADIVWFVINALDGRIFVCGSSKGMGEGVEASLIDVAMRKGGLSEAQAKEFWAKKKEDGQYIAVSSLLTKFCPTNTNFYAGNLVKS